MADTIIERQIGLGQIIIIVEAQNFCHCPRNKISFEKTTPFTIILNVNSMFHVLTECNQFQIPRILT